MVNRFAVWAPPSRERFGGRRGPVIDGEEYQSYLGNLLGMTSPQVLVRERPRSRMIESDKPEEHLVGILLPSDDGPSLRQFEFRIWFDRRYGFMPAKIEAYHRMQEELVLSSRMLVNKFHESNPGIWVPVEMTLTKYNTQANEYRGRAVNLYHATVDVSRSRWNTDLSDDLFLLPFPAGTRVADFVTNLQFTAGEGDDGKDLQALVAAATNKLEMNTPETHAVARRISPRCGQRTESPPRHLKNIARS